MAISAERFSYFLSEKQSDKRIFKQLAGHPLSHRRVETGSNVQLQGSSREEPTTQACKEAPTTQTYKLRMGRWRVKNWKAICGALK